MGPQRKVVIRYQFITLFYCQPCGLGGRSCPADRKQSWGLTEGLSRCFPAARASFISRGTSGVEQPDRSGRWPHTDRP